MPRLALYLLGAPRLELDGTPIDLERRKAVALLAYLALNPHAHSREALAALFWPDTDQSHAFGYLRTTLWTLNKALTDVWFEIERDTVALRPGTNFWLDVTWFRQLCATDDDCVEELIQAADLVQGDFMAGLALPDCPDFEDWQFFERENLQRDYAMLLERLITALMARGACTAAIPYARRWLALDPLHEPAHRALMHLYYAAGQRAAALRQYQQCQSILQDELGLEPDPATTALYEAIQANRDIPLLVSPPRPTASVHGRAHDHAPVVVESGGPPINHNLPASGSTFIGRATELTQLAQLLSDPGCRLLTILGPGGIGKTRLAIEAARRFTMPPAIRELTAMPSFPDGVYFVSLASISSALFFDSAIADALRFAPSRESNPHDQLLAYFREKRLLLILDNFEHLPDAIPLLLDILSAAPGVKLLATSRERLQVQEEWVYEIEGLSYPQNGTLDDFDTFGAVQLFSQSARRVRADFVLSPADKPYIAHICRAVEGMPLGVELAAGWLHMLSPQEIAAEIDRSFDFLSASWRDLPPRHRSLRAVCESTWSRLTFDEQAAMSRLSIFCGFTRQAAQDAVGAGLADLMTLANKSLIRRDPTHSGRYEMHELLRQFAEEKLELDTATRDRSYERHALYFANFLQTQIEVLKGPQQIGALDAIEADIDNIRTAWAWAIDHFHLGAIQGLMAGLSLFYLMRSRLMERKELFASALQHLQPRARTQDEKVVVARLRVLYGLTLLTLERIPAARHLYREAYPVLKRLNQPDLGVYFIGLSTLTTWPFDEHNAAEYWARRALTLFESYHDEWGMALALRTLGDVVHHQTRYEESATLYQQSLEITRRIGDRWGEGAALRALGEVAYTVGRYAEAEQLWREGLALNELIGDREFATNIITRVGEFLAIQGRNADAIHYYEKAVVRARQVGNMFAVGWGLFGQADIALTEGRLDDAARLQGEALAVFEANGQRDAIGWLSLSQTALALLQSDPASAQQHVQEAFGIFDTLNNPWGRAATIYYMGEIALARGDLTTARLLLVDSLKRARACNSIMWTLRILTGVARYLALAGEPERALQVLAFTLHHPACRAESKAWGGPLFDELQTKLAPAPATAALERGQSLELATVLTWFLDEEDSARP